MRIREKTWQHRRDFKAVYECEHCGRTEEGDGYDDSYFHEHVIPSKKCPDCGLASAGASSAPDVPAWAEL